MFVTGYFHTYKNIIDPNEISYNDNCSTETSPKRHFISASSDSAFSYFTVQVIVFVHFIQSVKVKSEETGGIISF